MTIKGALRTWFALVMAALLWATARASLDRNVFLGFQEVWDNPWGMATLFDAYFAFVAFWLWVAYKESGWPQRIAWLFAIFAFGNFAISAYMLIELGRLKPGEGFDTLLTRRN
jgi:hypothetical protein